MSKCKVTRKWVNSNYRCIAVSYARLQFLLNYTSPQYYTCGVYGWNCDIYTFGDVAITTGYRGMIDNCENNYSYDLAKKYDDLARDVIYSNKTGDYNNELKKLLRDFLKEVFDQDITVY